MIYIETGSEDASFNLALEYYFAAEKQLSDTVFLLWRTVPTLVVGKYQNVVQEVNKPYADAHDICIVRRMSGGGTIYSDLGGWMFTFICRGDADNIEFRQFIIPIVQAIRALGANADFNGRNDLIIDGRKFSGNAQYRLNGSVVHHGTLMFDTDIDRMFFATSPDPDKIESKGIKSVRDRVTNIAPHLHKKMDIMQFKEQLLNAIVPDSDIYVLTDADRTQIERIADEKFRGWNNLYVHNPEFSIRRQRRFAGGKIEALVNVQRGIITDIQFYGDFFAVGDINALCNLLRGCCYRYEDVCRTLADADVSIYKISTQEFAQVITDI